MLNINGVEIRAAKGGGLNARGGDEFIRGDGHGGNPKIFKIDGIVQTARAAGSSIGERFDDPLALRA